MLNRPKTTKNSQKNRVFVDPWRILLLVSLTGLFLAVTPPSRGALAQEDPYLKCADVKKGKRRLECYDTVLEAQHPEFFEKMTTARKKDQREEFGASELATGIEDLDKLKRLDVVITEFATDSQGRWILFTADGQIWKQSESRMLSPKTPDLPFEGKIKKGFMGNYMFVKKGSKRSIPVKRLK